MQRMHGPVLVLLAGLLTLLSGCGDSDSEGQSLGDRYTAGRAARVIFIAADSYSD